MGLFDKIAKTVQQVAEQLDTSGVVDKVNETLGGAAAETDAPPTGDDSGPLTGTPEEVVAAAVARGAFDVGAHITTDEVSEILGTPMTGPAYFNNAEWIGWVWTAQDPDDTAEVDVRVAFHVANGTPHEPSDLWRHLKEGPSGDGAEVVYSLGEDAFRRLDNVYVIHSSDIMFAWRTDKAEDVLRRILENRARSMG